MGYNICKIIPLWEMSSMFGQNKIEMYLISMYKIFKKNININYIINQRKFIRNSYIANNNII